MLHINGRIEYGLGECSVCNGFVGYNWLYAAIIHIDSLKSLGLLLKGLLLKVAILSKNLKHSQNIQTTIKHTKQKNKKHKFKNEKTTHNLQEKTTQKIHTIQTCFKQSQKVPNKSKKFHINPKSSKKKTKNVRSNTK